MSIEKTGRLNVKQAVPFFKVRQMDKSLHYYIHGLGFELKYKWEPAGRIEWCWLALDHAAIMLQEYRIETPYQNVDSGLSIYFICEDALSIYNKMNANGFSTSEPFVGNNMWVVELKDPDAYVIIFESPTDVTEGTKYSDWIIREKNN